ncbi:hypothetical protein DN069_07645 [Streptacidiphilus pinicola]|uniref:ATP/GTP-binding protein n=1 Tax=Streptacidiphilus pinicola TaxID=2219663 RepID=A0A2X0ISJ0_9ACTN|nr:hypothetical protein [Streptacidiphilus pinicola]RAG86221.1 hypothetical protein DN069_07645 [Streptacidiphilus pinicola]
MLKRVAVVLASAALAALVPNAASADGGTHTHVSAACQASNCTFGAASSTSQDSASGPSKSSGSAPVCAYVPAGAITTADDGSRGQWYRLDCGRGFDQGEFGGPALPLWAGAGQPGPAVSPVVVAQQAESELVLPSPVMSFSPAGFQVVRVPTWMWIEPVQWRPVTATAQVPGVSVTATATPSSVKWDLGDGTQLTCAGPGTPWRPGDDPRASSPDCGHVFLRPSADQPGGTYAVTVRVHWRVDWAGGGQQGVFPDLSSTTTVQVRVEEVHSVVTSNQTR